MQTWQQKREWMYGFRMLLNRSQPIATLSPNLFSSGRFVFFTGKGGVGKTSLACAVSVSLAESGRRVLLISTDPASNLQDVFGREVGTTPSPIPEAPNLEVVNIDPEAAATEYRKAALAPYVGLLPESVLANMEEQLSGSCTLEVAAFDRFTRYLAETEMISHYDHLIFDTAPTGHTLRLLQLPAAWSSFLESNTHGASCLGPLSGLQQRHDMYRNALTNLGNPALTTLVLVSRPEEVALAEALRSGGELAELGIRNQVFVLNGLLNESSDPLAHALYERQQSALRKYAAALEERRVYGLPLKPFNLVGLDHLRGLFQSNGGAIPANLPFPPHAQSWEALLDDLVQTGKRIVFTMGKGGVGKTTLAVALAQGLRRRGLPVLLTTTDPANHLEHFIGETTGVEVFPIDEQAELERYREEVLARAREMGATDLSVVEEDLRSPCIQEIAVFRAFAEVVHRSRDKVVVIDTAPTGHTLLLLDTTLSHQRQIAGSSAEVPESVRRLLPQLRDSSITEVIIVTLPEPTPVFEASRLRADLDRAGIPARWWVVNKCLYPIPTQDAILRSRQAAETVWVQKVIEQSGGQTVVIPYENP